MLQTQGVDEASVLKIFRKEKVLTLKQLAGLLHYCERTVQRRLKQWHSYTSYNQNGGYYTLADIPKFDQNGLWRYKDIFFSMYGNIKRTLKVLIDNSSTGLTVAEASRIVGLSLNSFMAQPGNIQQLQREKINGIFVYFSADEGTSFKQRKKREESIEQARLIKLPTDAEGIIILVERIKSPHLSLEQLSVKLSKKRQRIKAEVIKDFFEHHGLLKKTQDIQR
jgi:hypothetical protein